MTRASIVLLLSLAASACASAPPVAAVAAAAGPNLYEKKIAAILRLEDQRMLSDPAPPPAPAPALPPRGQRTPAVRPPEPPPDLIEMLSDDEARIRRRAALAIGRVRLAEGVGPLVALLKDEEPEVRQMAAFSLGLIGEMSARDALVASLGDPSPLVQGSAAEALGILGATDAADAIGRLAVQIVRSGAVTPPPADDDDARRDTPSSTLRLSLFALVRLKAYPQIAAAVLDEQALPRVRWWPVAYALQRIEDPRALPALLALARESHPYTRAFAVRGLGALKDRSAVAVLMPLLASGERFVLVEAIRALGRIADPSAAAPLLRMSRDQREEPQMRLEAANAIAGLHDPQIFDAMVDLLFDASPGIRAAALRALAAANRQNFITVLSSLDPDKDWTVRVVLANLLADLPPQIGLPRLAMMLNDTDRRVIPAVLSGLVKLHAPNAAAVLAERLKAEDFVVRSAAATGIGELKPSNGAQALAAAYHAWQSDSGYGARAAALAALSKYGAGAAMPVLREAFADKNWAVRVRAAQLAGQFTPALAPDFQSLIRPAPTTLAADTYQLSRIVNPPFSTQVFIDTDRGTIQLELAVLDAPLTAENFTALARKGYFNGLAVHRVVPDFVVQDGDPRGDGEGEPGYTIRDEFNERPYLRGAVGMALDPWPDTGGSQWFITHSPQPHLDAKYTVFGRVIAGMDVVDQIQQGDVIRSVRVWDGVQTSTDNR